MGALEGMVAVITGGGRGIGAAIAVRFAQEGAAIVVSSRTESELMATVEAARQRGATRAMAVVADAMDRAQACLPVTTALENFGTVHVLVNNVGGAVGYTDPFAGEDESFERTLTLSLTSAWWTSRAALPSMRDRGFGRIINIGSGASKHAVAGTVGYTAAKHGLVGFTRELAYACGPWGINVNLLCPGWTDTALLDFERMAKSRGTTADTERERAASENVQHRILDPNELAGIATLLAGADGGGITGQIISVDGGYRI